MYKRILITGCARSGNTLLLHLMGSSFKNTTMLKEEVFPHVTEGTINIGKFPKKAVEATKDYPDLGVIFTIRDPRDVIVSIHGLKPKKFWVEPQRWIHNAKIALEVKNKQNVYLLKYEDLLTNPIEIQENIAKKFGLKILRSFNEAYKYFDETDDIKNKIATNGFRPLDKTRIGNWKESDTKVKRVQKVLHDYPEIENLMKKFGYN